MTLFESITKDRVFSIDEIMFIYNVYRDLIDGTCNASLFDLHDDEDGMLWIKMYGLTHYRKSVTKARYWLGGAAHPVTETYPMTKSNCMDFLRTACVGCEEDIMQYCTGKKDSYLFDHVVKVYNASFNNMIDITEWCYANLPSNIRIQKYGKEWNVYPKFIQPNSKWRNNPDGEEDWLVLQLPTGDLWMNNKYGYMLITEENQTLYRDF